MVPARLIGSKDRTLARRARFRQRPPLL